MSKIIIDGKENEAIRHFRGETGKRIGQHSAGPHNEPGSAARGGGVWRDRRRIAFHAAALAASLGAAALALAHEGRHHFGAGEPAAAGPAAKTVEVVMSDADGKMAFTPNRLELHRGDVVTFVIRNSGAAVHEFVIGDRAENAEHARMMAEMPEMRHNDPNAKTVDPGKTSTLTWRFTHKGEFEFACLLPGHYEAGMHGVVIVK